MSGQGSIIATFIKRPADTNSGASILLEQEPFDSNTGIVTMLDMIQALEAQFFDYTGAVVDCGMNSAGNGFDLNVFAYPFPDDLAFETGITHGTAGAKIRQEVTKTEILSFALSDSMTMQYPVKRFISWQWITAAYDVTGNKIVDPEVVIDGQSVKVDRSIYGTIQVVYTTIQFAFHVSITARLTAAENVFQSCFYAYWDGGIEMIILDSPTNSEGGYIDQVDCAGNGSITIIDPDPDAEDVPKVEAKNKTVVLNYCEDFGNE